VTVGIGFGLQEIFANFVSGLILLFERPLRVGDIVTVGDTSGAVVRIQIRATTIRDWDNRELVLPNKTLITGGFLNWTLSDSITRIVCHVGIAYEADPRRARELLLGIARRHPAILAEPQPMVTFEGFGDSTLNLALRVHVSRTDQRAGTTFDLHATILEEFRQAGIEIAFPQRDLHLRSVPPGWALTQPPATRGATPTTGERG
jgi:potassium efflux system protein